ncbi:hypothetical protein D3C87_2029600 [compost metagenome]
MFLEIAIVEIDLGIEGNKLRPYRLRTFTEQRAGHHPNLVPLRNQVPGNAQHRVNVTGRCHGGHQNTCHNS